MKSFAIPLWTVFLTLICTSAYADEASKAAKIEEMLTLTHADRMVSQMLTQMQPIIAQQVQKAGLPDDARPAAEEMQKRMFDLLSSKLRWDRMKPVYVKIYAETLTEDEIAGAVAFYKTPAGQAILEKTPVLIQKSMSYTQEMLGDMMPELAKITEEVTKKYKKE